MFLEWEVPHEQLAALLQLLPHVDWHSEGKSKMALGAWYTYQALTHSYCYYLLLKLKLLV